MDPKTELTNTDTQHERFGDGAKGNIPDIAAASIRDEPVLRDQIGS